MSKTVVITGGAAGLGRKTATAFAAKGTNVVIGDLDTVRGEETAHEFCTSGVSAAFFRVDVTNADDVETFIQLAVRKYGHVDYAFNNAGIALPGHAIDQYPEEEWDRIIRVNLKGVWLCLKYECSQMLKQEGRAIVNTSSIRARVGRAQISAYCAAKAGVLGLTQSEALDYASRGIRINAICPGVIRTPMGIDSAHGAATANVIQNTPMNRMAEADEVAKAVVWLCSDAASYITGQAINIDGGYSAGTTS